MKNVPHCLRGPYTNAMRLAMDEANHSNAVVFALAQTSVTPTAQRWSRPQEQIGTSF